MMPYQDFFDFMMKIGLQAGQMIREDFGKAPHKLSKSAFEFKTKTDDRVDTFLRERIQQRYPEYGIIAEESGVYQEGAEYVWIIDPLDGTLNFTLGVTDLFAVSIALYYRSEPLLSLIYAPIRNDLYYAIKGGGAFKNDQQIFVAECPQMQDAVVALEYGKTQRQRLLPFQEKLLGTSGVHYTYVFCNATVPMAMTAEGKLSAYIGLTLDVWDIAAGVLINREAGNCVSNAKGEEWQMLDSSIFVAHPLLHPQLLQMYTQAT